MIPEEKIQSFLNDYRSTWSSLLLVAVNWKEGDPTRNNVSLLQVPFYLSDGELAYALYSYPARKFIYLEVRYLSTTFQIRL